MQKKKFKRTEKRAEIQVDDFWCLIYLIFSVSNNLHYKELENFEKHCWKKKNQTKTFKTEAEPKKDTKCSIYRNNNTWKQSDVFA